MQKFFGCAAVRCNSPEKSSNRPSKNKGCSTAVLEANLVSSEAIVVSSKSAHIPSGLKHVTAPDYLGSGMEVLV
jgi:hypothetical protein